ncbi:MAG TPA: hypothetical protein VLT36_04530 [Candidatus Dormibacteraeota bacterium]|nr:hypothetical protein [Candidatus Dormibacteraeota bacterium]
MPCPLFEPVRAVSLSSYAGARLPLIDEHDGFCHAAAEAIAVPAELRFRACNHGYSECLCGHWPTDETRSALRYSVTAQSDDALEIICVTEKDHAPVRWARVRYLVDTGALEPVLSDICMQAQALAFCRAYLKRFVSPEENVLRSLPE